MKRQNKHAYEPGQLYCLKTGVGAGFLASIISVQGLNVTILWTDGLITSAKATELRIALAMGHYMKIS